MNKNRALEILNSTANIEVTYKNSPIWIEGVTNDGSTAHVRLLTSDHRLDVPLTDLTEGR